MMLFPLWNAKRARKVIARRIMNSKLQKDRESNEYYRILWFPETNSWASQDKLYNKAFCHKHKERITSYLVNNFKMSGFTKEVDSVESENDTTWYRITFYRLARKN